MNITSQDTVSTTVVSDEALFATTVTLHKEYFEVATRACNSLHRHDNEGALGLVLPLQAQLRTNFGRTQVESKLKCTLADVFITSTLFETQFLDGDIHELNILLGLTHFEGGLAENFIRPFANKVSTNLESFANFVDVLERPELNGFPDFSLNSFSNGCFQKLLIKINQNFRITLAFQNKTVDLSLEFPESLKHIVITHDEFLSQYFVTHEASFFPRRNYGCVVIAKNLQKIKSF